MQKDCNMAKIQNVNVPHILKWEGGLSSAQTDSAKAFPSPVIDKKTGFKIHTNKGVTYQAWVALFGKNEVDRFIEMSNEDWLTCYTWYWNIVNANGIKSEIIGQFMAEWAWGSGGVTAARELQQFCNKWGNASLKEDGKIGAKSLAAINGMIEKYGQKWVFENLYNERMEFLRGLDGWKANGTGWTRRMEDFKKYAIKELGR